MKRWLALAFILSAFNSPGQDMNLYLKKQFIYNNGDTLPYRILYPENYNPKQKYPLLVFLHGSGERGNDNEKQLIHGARLFLKDTIRKNFPFIVVFPQCPESSSWSSHTNDYTQQPPGIFNYGNEPTWPLLAANELVKKIARKEGVDKSRIYISGLSMGGMGTFESIYRFPGLYAAAVPICGAGDDKSYDYRVTKTVFRVFHGDADKAVDVSYSRLMVERLKRLKTNVTYIEYPGVGHNSWDKAFAEPDFVSWMMQWKRKGVKL